MVRQRRHLVAVVLLLTVLAVATALTIGEPTYLQRLDYASGRDGCANVPMAPAVTPQTHPDSYRWPYGAVHACRVLDVVVPLFGEIDVSFNVLLETDTGLTVLRLEYLNVDAGRQYSVRGVELEPTGAGLSADEVARVRSAIADRGGLQPTPWIVTYGDG